MTTFRHKEQLGDLCILFVTQQQVCNLYSVVASQAVEVEVSCALATLNAFFNEEKIDDPGCFFRGFLVKAYVRLLDDFILLPIHTVRPDGADGGLVVELRMPSVDGSFVRSAVPVKALCATTLSDGDLYYAIAMTELHGDQCLFPAPLKLTSLRKELLYNLLRLLEWRNKARRFRQVLQLATGAGARVEALKRELDFTQVGGQYHVPSSSERDAIWARIEPLETEQQRYLADAQAVGFDEHGMEATQRAVEKLLRELEAAVHEAKRKEAQDADTVWRSAAAAAGAVGHDCDTGMALGMAPLRCSPSAGPVLLLQPAIGAETLRGEYDSPPAAKRQRTQPVIIEDEDGPGLRKAQLQMNYVYFRAALIRLLYKHGVTGGDGAGDWSKVLPKEALQEAVALQQRFEDAAAQLLREGYGFPEEVEIAFVYARLVQEEEELKQQHQQQQEQTGHGHRHDGAAAAVVAHTGLGAAVTVAAEREAATVAAAESGPAGAGLPNPHPGINTAEVLPEDALTVLAEAVLAAAATANVVVEPPLNLGAVGDAAVSMPEAPSGAVHEATAAQQPQAAAATGQQDGAGPSVASIAATPTGTAEPQPGSAPQPPRQPEPVAPRPSAAPAADTGAGGSAPGAAPYAAEASYPHPQQPYQATYWGHAAYADYTRLPAPYLASYSGAPSHYAAYDHHHPSHYYYQHGAYYDQQGYASAVWSSYDWTYGNTGYGAAGYGHYQYPPQAAEAQQGYAVYASAAQQAPDPAHATEEPVSPGREPVPRRVKAAALEAVATAAATAEDAPGRSLDRPAAPAVSAVSMGECSDDGPIKGQVHADAGLQADGRTRLGTEPGPAQARGSPLLVAPGPQAEQEIAATAAAEPPSLKQRPHNNAEHTHSRDLPQQQPEPQSPLAVTAELGPEREASPPSTFSSSCSDEEPHIPLKGQSSAEAPRPGRGQNRAPLGPAGQPAPRSPPAQGPHEREASPPSTFSSGDEEELPDDKGGRLPERVATPPVFFSDDESSE